MSDELSQEELMKELAARMKEIEDTKAQLWESGKYEPMMEGEYWDCQIVMRQTEKGENADISDLLQKKHDGLIAAQQQIHKVAEKE